MILDAGCLILRYALIVISKDIRHPGTSIKDQPVLAMIFVAMAQIECHVLYNHRI